MSKYQVYQHQSFLDVSILLTGTALNALLIAEHNGFSASDELTPGIELEIPENLNIELEIQKYYRINELIPATGFTKNEKDIIEGCDGIGCWVIEDDFIVS